MEQPLVSVVTITRNRGNLIGRCIASVLAQTYTNIEHIVVDGASDDNTAEVVAGFQDDRLRFIRLDSNWPIKQTLDYAVSLCRGKYITFLDSDDEYLPQKIRKQVILIESLPREYGLVYCWMTYYDNTSHNKLRIHNPSLRGDVRDLVIGEPVISGTPTLLFRLDVFKKNGGWKSVDDIGVASDWEMCARVCQITKVNYVPESLVNVYINHGSVRQSNGSYYNQYYERCVKFHKHFLGEFSSNFNRHPELAFNHYWGIFRAYFKLKQYFKSFRYLVKAITVNPRAFVVKLTRKQNHDKRY